MIKINITKEIEIFYLKSICTFFKNSRTYTYKQIAQIVKKDLNISFKKLLLMDIENFNTITSQKNKKIFKDLYRKFRNSVSSLQYIKKLNIDTCPYCNRNYIVNFSTTKKEHATAQFDHFYNKSDYPYLSISLYNLIPCCMTCNKIKSDKKEEILHPYQDDFNSLVKFQFTIKDNSFYYKHNGFDIKITSSNQKVQNTIDTFRLNDLYQNHKDIVLELIQKREIYSDSYIDELAHNYSGIFKNREDLLRLITCGYIEDKDLGKRPLSKLIKDVSEELELI